MSDEIVLFEHQKQTVKFMQDNPYCLNFSEAGTGKTFPCCVLCKGKKSTIVAPAFLLKNWQREMLRFDIKATIFPEISDITLVSQDMIYKSSAPFIGLDVLIVDECHGFCSTTTRRTKALHEYVKNLKPKRLVLMSGTPIRSNIPQLYSLMLLVDYGRDGAFKRQYPNQYIFNYAFTHPVEKHFGKRKVTAFEGSRNLQTLRDLLRPLYIKYKVTDLHDFPNVTFTEFTSEDPPEDILWLDAQLEEGWEQMEQFNSPPPLHISTAKLESAEAKVDTTIEYCKTLLEGGADHLVVFSDHVNPARRICDGLKEYGSGVILGETSMKDRDDTVQRFQSGNLRVIVGTLGAMGTGLTLTKAHICVRNDLNWTVAINAQAVGRVRRISQTKKVMVVDIVREGIDRRIARKLREKEKIIQETVGG